MNKFLSLRDEIEDRLREVCLERTRLPKRKRTMRWRIAHETRVDMLIEFFHMANRRIARPARHTP